MLLTRLSVTGAKLFGTTNPDNPHHWLKADYIDRQDEIDLLDMKFLIDDNTKLDPDYVRQLKSENTGVFYDRFILGKWVAAEGAIYRQFADCPESFTIDSAPDNIWFASIGVDFGGNKSAHAFICTGFTRGFKKIIVLDEFYLKKQISPTQLENHFADFVRKNKAKYRIYEAYCDSAETTIIRGLTGKVITDRLGIDVRGAIKGEIINRIRLFQQLMAQNRFFLLRGCSNISTALSEAVWNDKSATDERLDDGTVNIDSIDAMEYSVEKYMGDIIDMGVIKNDN